MFEDMRLSLLNKKLNLLMEKELNLLKQGKEKEANLIAKDIEEVSQKIEQIIDKRLVKTGKKADELTQQLDKNMRSPYDSFPEITQEEAEEKLDEIMRSGR